MFGNLLIITAALCDVIGTILIKPTLSKLPVTQIVAMRFTIAAIILLPLATTQFNSIGRIEFSTGVIIALVYNFTFATIAAFFLFHWSLRHISGEQISPLHYLDPTTGAVGSIFILGEQLTTSMLLGTVLIIVGLYFSETRKLYHIPHIGHHR